MPAEAPEPWSSKYLHSYKEDLVTATAITRDIISWIHPAVPGKPQNPGRANTYVPLMNTPIFCLPRPTHEDTNKSPLLATGSVRYDISLLKVQESCAHCAHIAQQIFSSGAFDTILDTLQQFSSVLLSNDCPDLNRKCWFTYKSPTEK